MNNSQLKKLKVNLPKKPGILGKNEYFNSAVLIPIIEIKGESHLLFEKRALDIRQGGEICFPGGEYDSHLDKSFKDTAIREAKEELGIKASQIEILGCLDTLVGAMGITIDSIVAKLNILDLNKLQIDKNEVEKILTVPISFFIDNKPEIFKPMIQVVPYIEENGKRIELFPTKLLNLPEKYNKPWNVRHQKVLVYKFEGEAIWGLTAILVHELIKKIEQN